MTTSLKNFLESSKMHCLGPYVVKVVTDGGAVQLVKLSGEPFPKKVNGNCLKPYMGGSAIWLTDQSTIFMTREAEQWCETINIGTKSQH